MVGSDPLFDMAQTPDEALFAPLSPVFVFYGKNAFVTDCVQPLDVDAPVDLAESGDDVPPPPSCQITDVSQHVLFDLCVLRVGMKDAIPVTIHCPQ